LKPQLIDINLSGKRTIQIKKLEMDNLTSPFHFHNLCELVWIEKSYGKRIVGDSIDNFEDGDLVLMGPNLPHIWLNDKIYQQELKGNNVKSTVIYFPSDFLLNLTDEQHILNPTADLILRSARGLTFYGETSKEVIKILSNISEKKDLKKSYIFSRLSKFYQFPMNIITWPVYLLKIHTMKKIPPGSIKCTNF